MADTVGEQDIRGIDVDRAVKGFADEQNVFRKFIINSTTTSREIRWFQKTAGVLDSVTTDDTSISLGELAPGTQPAIIGPSWTRQTSNVRKFMFESETITDEDIKDSDLDILGTMIRDITRAVQRKVDLRIFSVLVEAADATPTTPNPTLVNTTAAVATWSTDATANPIKDIAVGQRKIRQNSYEPKSAVIGLNSLEHEALVNWLITVKGSSIPGLSSNLAQKGAVMSIMDNAVIVSENFTTGYMYMWIPGRSLTYKSFISIKAIVMNDPLIGKKVRVVEEGEAILTDPKSVHITTSTL